MNLQNEKWHERAEKAVAEVLQTNKKVCQNELSEMKPKLRCVYLQNDLNSKEKGKKNS